MHLRAHLIVLVLLATASTAGCFENMESLKEALGFGDPPPTPEPDPVYAPPVAKAQANATSVLAGASVRFTSEGSRDPQGLPLTFTWHFGDGRSATGASVTHAYAKGGEFTVRLVVENDKGLGDEDVLTLQVAEGNRRPVAAFRVLDAKGAIATVAEMGEPLAFDGNASSDPEGDPLLYDWDFGDGSTSHDAKPTHAYDRPGLFTVRLKVADRAQLTAEASRVLAVNATYTVRERFEPTSPAVATALEFPLAEGAENLTLTLTFPAAAGYNDLTLVLKDAKGEKVREDAAGTPPGSQAPQVRSISLIGDELDQLARGAYAVEVHKARNVPMQVEYTLVVRESF